MDIRYHILGYPTRMTPKKGGYMTYAPALDVTTLFEVILPPFLTAEFSPPLYQRGGGHGCQPRGCRECQSYISVLANQVFLKAIL